MPSPAHSTDVEAVYSASRGPARSPARARSAILPGPLKLCLVVVLGVIMGLGSTALILERRLDPATITVGPWTAWAKAGTVDIDPYAQAILASTGEVALASAEGMVFKAWSDGTGAALSTRCRYRVAGAVPASRFWTISAATPAGRSMENLAGRSGFSSMEVLRREDGGFEIEASPSVRPGNWLPLSGAGRFVLSLRLYDTPLTLVATDAEKIALPSVSRLGCGS